ncbi:hypothetical protein [Pararhizobium sp. IMCC21322]|uniref:hypothetical protein n=1 Tax=Pararhizobium sp. IMCC21322 TaxID=3067903 RepID=UPI00274037E7|nr:hypothetical protein [Pararhizobium sp. IMCC21322]
MFTMPFRCLAFGVTAAITLLSSQTVWAQETWMVVTHEVEDFDRWKEVFDQALSTRRSVGEMASYIMHNPVDQNMITVWFEWDTMERARAWVADPALANGMIAAGVVSTPVFGFRDIESTN